MITIKNYDEMKNYIINQFPFEGVGLIVNDSFVPVDNIADDPVHFFKVSNDDIAKHIDNMQAVIHSHTITQYANGYDPRCPSHEDMISQEAIDLPYGIVHCDGNDISEILWFGDDTIPELIGRDYAAGVTDCFTLARDYYRLNYNIDFGTHPRPTNWEEWNPHYIAQHYTDLGFYDISEEDILPGDIILFSIGSRHPNHIGIVISENEFIHHLYNRQSNKDTIHRWNRQITKYIRHHEVNQ